jgi:hypothetical protein
MCPGPVIVALRNSPADSGVCAIVPPGFASNHALYKDLPVKHRSLAFFLIVLAFAFAGCESSPKNRGSSGGRIDPTSDASSEEGSLDLRSADLVAATDRMAADIASRLDINNRASPPSVFVGEIENRTSAPEQNYQVFLQRLRAQLNASAARQGMTFIRERQFVEEQRQREYAGRDPEGTSAGYRSAADYVLTCEVHDLPTAGANYFLLDYQLVQLRGAAGGPDLGAGVIVWENSYEVKYR